MNDFKYAGFWWRFLAISIDGIVLFIPSLIITIIISTVVGLPLLLSGIDQHLIEAINWLAGSIGDIIMTWLYHASLESSPWQGTVGKKLCGLIVTDREGNRISFRQASVRAFSRYLSGLLFFGYGYVMAAFSPQKLALHDKIAQTLVLKRPNQPTSPQQ